MGVSRVLFPFISVEGKVVFFSGQFDLSFFFSLSFGSELKLKNQLIPCAVTWLDAAEFVGT